MGSVIASGVGVCSPVSTWTFVEKGKKEFMKKEKAPSAKAEGEAEPEDFDGDRELRRVRPARAGHASYGIRVPYSCARELDAHA